MQLVGQVTRAVVGPKNSVPLQMSVPTLSYQALAQPMLMLQVWRAQVPCVAAAAAAAATAAIAWLADCCTTAY